VFNNTKKRRINRLEQPYPFSELQQLDGFPGVHLVGDALEDAIREYMKNHKVE